LKRAASGNGEVVLTWDAFPGRERPGLIEAPSSPRSASSRLDFPGRERPGLIEALALPRRALPGPAFRGASAPASLSLF